MKPWWFLPVIAVALWCGVRATQRGFEYDELWTLENYARAESVGVIFEDLTVPNNHPLHSLLVRLSVRLLGESEGATRLPALLAGVLALGLIPAVVWWWTEDGTLAWMTGLLAALNPALLHFAQTARGYSLQVLAVMVFAGAVVLSRRDSRWLLGMLVAGVAGLLTMPTTILFLIPIVVADLTLRRRQPVVWGAYAVLGVLGGSWLCFGAAQWAQGRAQFGLPVTSLRDWLAFAGQTIRELWGWWLPAWMVVGVVSERGRVLGAVLLVPLLAAVATHAGPTRAYLPLIPAGLLLAALGVRRVGDWLPRGRQVPAGVAIGAAAIALPMGLRLWTPTDWRAAVPSIRAVATPGYIAYRPTDGYVVRHYFGNEAVGTVPRASVITVAAVAGLSGMDLRTHRSVALELPADLGVTQLTVAGVSVTRLRAAQVVGGEPADDRLLFLVSEGAVPREVLDWGWVQLNGFFTGSAPVVLARRGVIAQPTDGVRLYRQVPW